MSSSRSAGSGRSTSSLTPTSRSTSLDGGLLMRPIIALISIRVEITVWTLIQTRITVWTVIQESGAASTSASARVNDTYGGLGVLPTLTSHNGTTNATKENRMHKPTDTDLDQSPPKIPPGGGLLSPRNPWPPVGLGIPAPCRPCSRPLGQ